MKAMAARRQEAGNVQAQIVWGAEISSIRNDWQVFTERVTPENFFIRPHVLDAWQTHLARDPLYGMILVRRDDQIIGAMPVMRRFGWRKPTFGMRYDYDPYDKAWLTQPNRGFIPVRQMGPVISLPATMVGPVLAMAPDDSTDVIRQIAKTFAQTGGWDLSVLPVEDHLLPIWQDQLAAVGLRQVVQSLGREAVFLAKMDGLDGVIARQSGKRRQNFRRARAAGERIGLKITLCRDGDVVAETLAQLANKSWKASGRAGEHIAVPYRGPQQAFVEALILGPERPNMLAFIAEHEGEPAAIVLGIVQGRRLITLLTFWDGSHPDATPGTMVMGAIIDWAHHQGLTSVDFNSGAPWLRIFADHKLVQHNLIVFGPGIGGAALRNVRRLAVFARDVIHRLRRVPE